MLQNTDFDKIIIDSIDLVSAFDKADGSLKFLFDQVQDGTITNGAEIVYQTGKSGMRIAAIDRNKTSTFTCNNGYVIVSAYASQLGSEVVNAGSGAPIVVPTVEFIRVGAEGTTITLSATPSGPEGAEIPFIYKANKDKTQGKKFAIAGEASKSEFSLAGTTITLPTDVFAEGDIVIVPYDAEVTVGKKIVNSGDNFSDTVRLVIDCTCRDVCNNSVVYHGTFVFGNAKIDGNFDIAFGDTPTVHAFSAEAMADICSTDQELFAFFIK